MASTDSQEMFAVGLPMRKIDSSSRLMSPVRAPTIKSTSETVLAKLDRASCLTCSTLSKTKTLMVTAIIANATPLKR